MLTHQLLNRHQRLIPDIRILVSHELHDPGLSSQIRHGLLCFIASVPDEAAEVMRGDRKDTGILALLEQLDQASGVSSPHCEAVVTSLDRLAPAFLPNPQAVLLPELLALVRWAPYQVTRLELRDVFVVCRQVIQTRRKLSLEILEVFDDFLVGPFARLEGSDEGQELGSEHGRDVLRRGDGEEVLHVSREYDKSMWALTRRVATTTRCTFSLTAAFATPTSRAMTSYFLPISLTPRAPFCSAHLSRPSAATRSKLNCQSELIAQYCDCGFGFVFRLLIKLALARASVWE